MNWLKIYKNWIWSSAKFKTIIWCMIGTSWAFLKCKSSLSIKYKKPIFQNESRALRKNLEFYQRPTWNSLFRTLYIQNTKYSQLSYCCRTFLSSTCRFQTNIWSSCLKKLRNLNKSRMIFTKNFLTLGKKYNKFRIQKKITKL